MANKTVKNFELSYNFELTMFELTGSDLYKLNGSAIVCCPGDCPFESEPSPTSSDVQGSDLLCCQLPRGWNV